MKSPHLPLELAAELGFDIAGVAPLRPPAAGKKFQRWLDAGHHADMAWLERNRDRIGDPTLVLPGGQSLLVVGLSHRRDPVELAGGGRVARYAGGRDYHNVVGKLLGKLERRLRAAGWKGRTRRLVDAGPLLERSHAAEAGLGFESRAANLLHPRLGPWFFLGEVLLEDRVEPTPAPRFPSCGSCTACLDACPTDALREPGVLDARLCISYHTIENRGPIPHAIRDHLRGWLFGCDICSEVCPWGRKAPDVAARYGTHPFVDRGGLPDLLGVSDAAFPELFRGSPLRRPGRIGLARNAALLLGLQPRAEGRRALERALAHDPSPVVREAAAWALLVGHGSERGVGSLVDRAIVRESDPRARRDMRRSQERSPA